jgi:ubiquilin
MHLNVKSPKRFFQIEVDDNATVLRLKHAIEEAHPDIAAANLRLIYAGKVLVDDRPLQFYSMQSGHSVHMVISPARPQPEPAPRPPPQRDEARHPTLRESLAGVSLGRMTQHPVLYLFGPSFFQNPEAFAAIIDAIPILAHDPEIRELRRSADARQAALRDLEALAGGEIQWASPFGIPDIGHVDIVAYMNSPLGQQMMRHVAEHPDALLDAYRNSPVADRNPMVRELFDRPHLIEDGVRAVQEMLADPEHMREMFHVAHELLLRPPAGQQAGGNGALDLRLPILGQDVANLGAAGLIDEEEDEEEEEEDFGDRELFDAAWGVRAPPAVLHVDAPPEQRFAVQLGLMEEMGFLDLQRNVQTLIATNGDLEMAVEWLLTRQ